MELTGITFYYIMNDYYDNRENIGKTKRRFSIHELIDERGISTYFLLDTEYFAIETDMFLRYIQSPSSLQKAVKI